MSDANNCPHDHVDGWYVGIEGCRGCGKVVDWHDGEDAPVFAEIRAVKAQHEDDVSLLMLAGQHVSNVEAERDRLRHGIAAHLRYSERPTTSTDLTLWSLLDGEATDV